MDERCDTCRYSRPVAPLPGVMLEVGVTQPLGCNAHPPTVVIMQDPRAGAGVTGMTVPVRPEAWCGEWQAWPWWRRLVDWVSDRWDARLKPGAKPDGSRAKPGVESAGNGRKRPRIVG